MGLFYWLLSTALYFFDYIVLVTALQASAAVAKDSAMVTHALDLVECYACHDPYCVQFGELGACTGTRLSDRLTD